MADSTETPTMAWNLTTADYMSAEELEIFRTITGFFMYFSMGGDIFSIFSSAISAVIFKRLISQSPLFLLFLLLNIFQFFQAILDTIEYIWRLFSFYGLHIDLYHNRIWSQLIYPIIYQLYLSQIWFLVLIVVERLYKNRNVAPWDHMKVLRLSALTFIVCLASIMGQFFERALTYDPSSQYYYHIIYGIVLLMSGSFFVPFSAIIGISIFIAIRYLNKPYSHLSREDLNERARTKVALLVAVCFTFSNSIAYVIYFMYVTGGWDVNNLSWRIYSLLFELHTMLSSVNAFLGTIYYLFFLPDYRRLFLAVIYKLLSLCGCRRFLSDQNQADAVVYSELGDERGVQ